MSNLKKKLKENSESGEIMLESTIILFFTLLIIFAMLSLGFLYYQKVAVQTIANETAAYVATNYKYHMNDLDSTTVEVGDLSEMKKFRSTFAVKSLEKENKESAEAFIDERINLTSFGLNDNVDLDNFEIVVDNIGRMHVDCTVSVKSEIFMGGVLEFLGITDSSTLTFYGSSRAEIIDVTGYGSYNNFVRYFAARLKDTMVNVNSICESISTLVEFVQKYLSYLTV